MLLEVCVDSLASARAAIAGGADRLELCSALLAGGLTPYTELLRQIRHESDVAVRCLMRPRAGDFLYMPEEIEMMCAQITELRSAGANGFVIGCLNPDGTLNTTFLRSAKATAAYTCRDGQQTYSPRFTYMGFRYAGIKGVKPEDVEVEAVALTPMWHTPEPSTVQTSCSTSCSPTLHGAQSPILLIFRPTAPSAMSGWAGPETSMSLHRQYYTTLS